MNLNRKLRAVIRHEFLTIIRQPSFWISLISIPAILAAIVAISYFTNSSNEVNVDSAKNELNIVLVDESDLVLPEVASAFNLTTQQTVDQHTLQERVRIGELDGLIIYPKDVVQSGQYLIFADNTDRDNASSVNEIARLTLQQSILAPLASPELANLALSGGEGKIQKYAEGEPSREFVEYIVPGSFLVIFYIVLVFSVGYALTTVSEEKENRSIEMVLSYVKPQTLILGKLLAVILVTLVQIAFFALLGVVAFIVIKSLGNTISLPFSFSDLTFEPQAILFGFAFLLAGFIFFVGLMAIIGAIFPSTKDASGFSSVFYLLPAIPFWGMSTITKQPDSIFTQVLTYFPLTSPTTNLLRNTVGNIGVLEALLALLLLMTAIVGAILLAGKAFRLGTLEYTSRVKLTTLLKK